MYLDYNINQIHNLFNKSKKMNLLITVIGESNIVFIYIKYDSFEDSRSSKIFFTINDSFVKKIMNKYTNT